MSGRSAHRIGVLLLVLLAALVVSGCGGTEETTTTTIAGGTSTTTRADGEEPGKSLVGTSVQPTDDSPAEFVEAYGTRPIVLLFYVPGSTDDLSVLESLTRLQPGYGDYTFLLYDYKMADAYGDLSTLLKVGYPPELVLIDKAGIIQEIWNGYIDDGTLNQGLVNLGGS